MIPLSDRLRGHVECTSVRSVEWRNEYVALTQMVFILNSNALQPSLRHCCASLREKQTTVLFTNE